MLLPICCFTLAYSFTFYYYVLSLHDLFHFIFYINSYPTSTTASTSKDGIIESKPIKGTARRNLGDLLIDAKIATDLRDDEKSQAENLMVVDLVRNDFGRVCEVGSVTVPDLMRVETFASVHQLVSTIKGKLQQGRSLVDAIVATFPGGSMTGRICISVCVSVCIAVFSLFASLSLLASLSVSLFVSLSLSLYASLSVSLFVSLSLSSVDALNTLDLTSHLMKSIYRPLHCCNLSPLWYFSDSVFLSQFFLITPPIQDLITHTLFLIIKLDDSYSQCAGPSWNHFP